MINLVTEHLLSLTDARRLLPAGRNGSAVHLSCILRWILTGAKAPGGDRIRLDAARVGGRWLTSREALQRFAEALTPSLDDKAPRARTPRQRERSAARAAKELESHGI
ncbi:MAG TPA: DUF1580 domain-containing protein [Gemmataceae bacterium]|nr:DUF1580 domain-containing protein [Gemmataceae bacterium]